MELFEIIAHKGEGIDTLPEPNVPYYVIAKEGTYIHRGTQIGNVLLREYKQPESLGRIGYKDGIFTWKSPKIPGHIISQAHDFFARVYEKHHAEAEVLITMHNQTQEYRLFVPFQRVNHGGVKSVYEPTHIDRNYTVIGTLHSHCDFTAFHSGTDSGDASDMDGVHFTIGKVNSKDPEIVAMVAMNGKEFHYKNPADIADIEFRTKTSPLWWDNFLYPGNDAPKEKPKGLKSLEQSHWNEFLGLALVKPRVITSNIQKWEPIKPGTTWNAVNRKWEPIKKTKIAPDNWRDRYYSGEGLLNESKRFNKGRTRNIKWGEEDELILPNKNNDPITKLLDFAEDQRVLSDDDWRHIKASDVDDINYWKRFFVEKLGATMDVLAMLNIDIEWNLADEKGKES